MAADLIPSLDQTVRTFTFIPSERLLIEFDPYFRNSGLYEVQRVVVEVELGAADEPVIREPDVIGRKVAKSDTSKYTSGEWHVYNTGIRDKALTIVRNLLSLEAPKCTCSTLRRQAGTHAATCPVVR